MIIHWWYCCLALIRRYVQERILSHPWCAYDLYSISSSIWLCLYLITRVAFALILGGNELKWLTVMNKTMDFIDDSSRKIWYSENLHNAVRATFVWKRLLIICRSNYEHYLIFESGTDVCLDALSFMHTLISHAILTANVSELLIDCCCCFWCLF